MQYKHSLSVSVCVVYASYAPSSQYMTKEHSYGWAISSCLVLLQLALCGGGGGGGGGVSM